MVLLSLLISKVALHFTIRFSKPWSDTSQYQVWNRGWLPAAEKAPQHGHQASRLTNLTQRRRDGGGVQRQWQATPNPTFDDETCKKLSSFWQQHCQAENRQLELLALLIRQPRVLLWRGRAPGRPGKVALCYEGAFQLRARAAELVFGLVARLRRRGQCYQ